MTGDHWFTAENPLLSALPLESLALEKLPPLLRYDPLKGLPIHALSFEERCALLQMEKCPFEPTAQSLRIALKIYGMVLGHLRIINPTLVQNRRRIIQLQHTAAEGATSLPAWARMTSSCLAVKGITGTGKSISVLRCLSLLPPAIVHGPCKAAGWLSQQQLVYLYANAPHDGTRGGFLTAILTEVDGLLGTDYSTNLPRRHKSIERLCVGVIAMLHSHHLGVMIVDEAQLRNLIEANQAEQTQLFLLEILNSGIPIVLIGNPLVFGELTHFSQDTRRIFTQESEFLHPVGAIPGARSEDDWKAISSGITRYYVLKQAPQDLAACSDVLLGCSGGIPGLSSALWCQTQLNCLLNRKETITGADIEATYSGPGFDEFRPLAQGFALKLPDLLATISDVPYAYYGRLWGKVEDGESKLAQAAVRTISNPDKSKQAGRARAGVADKSLIKKMKAEKTRKKNKEIKRAALQDTLLPEDMRAAGLRKTLLTGLEELRGSIESNS